MDRFPKLKKIIEKNFKLLTRSKSSALIIIFGPIILVTLLGLAFGNTQQYKISVGVYSPSYNELADSLVEKLEQRDFGVAKEPTESICIEKVKTRESNVCLVLPENLQIKEDLMQDITFHVDYSSVNLVYNIILALSEGVGDTAKEVSISLTQDLLTRLQKADKLVGENMPAVVQLTKDNSNVSDRIRQIQAALGSLQLDMQSNASMTQIETEIAYLRNLASQSMQETSDLIDQLNAEIEILRGNTSRAEYYLDKADEKFGDFKMDLKDSDQKMEAELEKFRSYISDASQKLGSAKAVQSDSKATLEAVKMDLESDLALLSQVQTALNEMKRLTTTVEISSAEKIINPLTTKIVPVADQETHFNYLFPTLVVLVVMITSILLSSTIVMVEKKSKSFFRNYITPTHEILFLAGTYLTTLIIIIMQTAIFFLVSSVFFGTEFLSSFFKVPFLLFFIITFFTLAGILIGIIFKSEELTTLASITVASVMLFFSNAMLPVESMPSFFKTLASLNPFVISENLLKEAVLFDLGIGLLMNKLYLLILYIAILAFACLKMQEHVRTDTFYSLHQSKGLFRIKNTLNRFGGASGGRTLTANIAGTMAKVKSKFKKELGLKEGKFSMAGVKHLKNMLTGAVQDDESQGPAVLNDEFEAQLMKESDSAQSIQSIFPGISKGISQNAQNASQGLGSRVADSKELAELESEINELKNKLKDL